MDRAIVDHLLITTRTVRKHLDLTRSVEPEVIEQCIEIATQAPTGSNAQGWHFVVITEADKRASVAEFYKNLLASISTRGTGDSHWSTQRLYPKNK